MSDAKIVWGHRRDENSAVIPRTKEHRDTMSDITRLWNYDRRAFWACTFIGAIIAGVISGAYWMDRILNNPPDANLTAVILNPVIEQSGTMKLMVTIKSTAKRQCSGDITREFWRMVKVGNDTIPEKWRESAPRPIQVVGESQYIINVKLPADLETGVWSFRGETAYFCDGWFNSSKRYRSNLEDAITVVPKGSLK